MRKVYRFRIVKLALLMLACAPAFVAVGVWFLLQRPDSPAVWVLSLADILFFGGVFLIGLYSLPRMIRNSEALILTPESLILRQVGRAGQTVIRWPEIAGLSERYIKSAHFIILHLHNPELHMRHEPNSFWRRLMKLDTRCFGSPYSISPDSIRCNADELLRTLLNYLETYGQVPPNGNDTH